MFDDDLILFSGTNVDEVEVLQDCLDTIKQWYGQCVKVEKSSIFRSHNAFNDTLVDLRAVMRVICQYWIIRVIKLPLGVVLGVCLIVLLTSSSQD